MPIALYSNKKEYPSYGVPGGPKISITASAV